MDRPPRRAARRTYLATLSIALICLAPTLATAGGRQRAAIQPAPQVSKTLAGPSLWHVVDALVDPIQRPPILQGTRSLWCGKYDPCWVDSIGYPNLAYEVLYIDTGTHLADYILDLDMLASTELFYDYVYLIGGGGGATDPIGNSSLTIDTIIQTGSSGNSRLLVSWTGSIRPSTLGATGINTTNGPATVSETSSGQPSPLTTHITIASGHRALYFVLRTDCLFSPQDGLWPYGPGVVLDNVAASDKGFIYADGLPAGGSDAYGGAVITGTPGAPIISSRGIQIANQAPSITPAPNQTRNEGESISLTTTATDPDAGNSVHISAFGYPAGLTQTHSDGNTASATLSGTLTCAVARSPYTITWCVSSPFHEDLATTVLTVAGDPHAPVVTAPASLTRAVGSIVDFEAYASDPDGDVLDDFTADLSTLPPADPVVFVANGANTLGTFRWSPVSGDEGTYIVKFLASNALTGCAPTVIHVVSATATGVEVNDGAPAAVWLDPNRPNPFNPRTSIHFGLPREGRVVLDIFDVRGRRVVRLLDRVFPAGSWGATWDGRDDRGREVASGVYYDRLEAAGVAMSRRMVLLR